MNAKAVKSTPKSQNGAKVPKIGVWQSIRIPLLVIVVVGGLFAAVLYARFAYVSGNELNPRNWTMRSFSYYRDPFTGRQITGIKHAGATRTTPWLNTSQTFAVHASISQHFNSKMPTTDRWDLVDINHPHSSRGAAFILVDLLSARTLDWGDYWEEWSTKNPRLAAELWPALQALAILNLYVDMPPLIEAAQTTTDHSELASLVHAHVTKVIVESVRELKAAGDLVSAKEAAEVGLLFGDNTEFLDIIEQTGSSDDDAGGGTTEPGGESPGKGTPE